MTPALALAAAAAIAPFAIAPFAVAQVQINEVVAKNETGARDEQMEFEDWIELRNAGSSPVAVSGMYVTDDVNTPTKWKIPDGFTLQPGATLLIWADNEPTEGPLHATFKLDNEAEEVALFDTNGTTRLDYIAWTKLRTDNSIGRMFDGGDLWVSFPQPTPNAPNATSACGTRRYSSRRPGANDLTLTPSGSPKIGTTMQLALTTAPPDAPVGLLLSIAPVHVELPFTTAILVVQLPFFSLGSRRTDANGAADLSFPVPPLSDLVDQALYFQAFGIGPTKIDLANAVEIRFCR